jgi:hypothetical protein
MCVYVYVTCSPCFLSLSVSLLLCPTHYPCMRIVFDLQRRKKSISFLCRVQSVCVYMYVCMYVCTYVCMYVCGFSFIFLCALSRRSLPHVPYIGNARIHAQTANFKLMLEYMHYDTHTYIHNTQTHTHICTYTYTYTYTYIYIYIYNIHAVLWRPLLFACFPSSDGDALHMNVCMFTVHASIYIHTYMGITHTSSYRGT